MILRQFLHVDPIAASYIVGCGGQAACAVIDPIASPRFYLQAAADLGMRIRHVIDTHVHADHRSTGHALAREAGAAYSLHESVAPEFDFTRARDGDRLEVGNVL